MFERDTAIQQLYGFSGFMFGTLLSSQNSGIISTQKRPGCIKPLFPTPISLEMLRKWTMMKKMQM